MDDHERRTPMKKRILSTLMALTLCLQLLPTAALAAADNSTYVTAPDTAAESADAVAAVQRLIDALPEADALADMDEEAVNAAYGQVQTAYDAYDALTEGQKALITGSEVFASLFAWFNAQVTALSYDCNEGYNHKLLEGSTMCQYCGKTLVVQIGDNYYTSLGGEYGAFNEVWYGNLTLLTSSPENATFEKAPSDNAKTLYLNGKSLSDKITMNGEDYVTSTGTSYKPRLILKNGASSDGYVHQVECIKGEVTINDTGVYVSTLTATGGTVNVIKGTVNTLNIPSGSTAAVTISGGTVRNLNFASDSTATVTLSQSAYDMLMENGWSLGDAFCYRTGTEGSYSYSQNFTDGATVVKCSGSHEWSAGNYKCTTCGKACPHTSITSDNKCTLCATSLEVKVTADNCASLGLDSSYIDYYAIASDTDLYWFAALVNGTLTDSETPYPNAKAVLTSDINVNSGVIVNGALVSDTSSFSQWTPIGIYTTNGEKDFAGIFDGNGHTISGLYTTGVERGAGLFGYTASAAVIKNVTVADSYFEATEKNVAGIAGYLEGTAEKCGVVNCVIKSENQVGGIAGLQDGGTIRYCYCKDIVITATGDSGYAGGLSGAIQKKSTLEYSYCTGTINCSGTYKAAITILAGSKENKKKISIHTCYYNMTGVSEAHDQNTDFLNNPDIRDIWYAYPRYFTSGKVAWELNGEKAEGVWKQTLDGSSYPSFTGDTVYKLPKYGVYSNTPHTHDWNYSTDGAASITVACSKVNECDMTGRVTISAPGGSLSYTGSAITASYAYSSDWPVDKPGLTISYEYKATSQGTYSSVAAPIAAGYYRASITLGGQTAFVEYEIGRAEITNCDAPTAYDKTYNFGDSLGLVSPGGCPECGTIYYRLGETGSWTDDSNAITVTEVGTYTIYWYVKGNSNHTDLGSADSPYGHFTATVSPYDIKNLPAKRELHCTPTVLTYTGAPQTPAWTVKLVQAGDTGISSYELATLTLGKDFTLTCMPQTNVGEGYTATIVGKGNYTGSVTVYWSIGKGTLTENTHYTAPTASLLTYTGEAQSLLTPGSTRGGTMYYRLNNGQWSTTVPTATNAGDYTVDWYIDGGANWESVGSATTPAGTLAVSIRRAAQAALTMTEEQLTVTYGKTLTLAATGGSGTGDVTFEVVSGGTGAASITGNTLAATGAGTVLVKAVKAGDGNYLDAESKAVTVTINKAASSVTPQYTAITESGKTLADAALSAGVSNTSGTISWVDASGSALPATTAVEANVSYRWLFTPADGQNYTTTGGFILLYPHVDGEESAEVGGKVEQDGHVLSNVTLTLKSGNIIVATTVTDENGAYTFPHVAPGLYNLIAEKDGIVVTRLVTVERNNIVEDFQLPPYKTNSAVEIKGDSSAALNIVVGGLDELFTQSSNNSLFTHEDKEIAVAGGEVRFDFSVEQKKDNKPASAIEEKITKDSGVKVGMVFSFDVTKTVTPVVGSSSSTEVTETGKLLTTVIQLPPELQGMSSYTVYRLHNGEVHVLTTTPNEKGEYIVVSADKTTITIYASQYSEYVIGYTEPENSTAPSGGHHPLHVSGTATETRESPETFDAGIGLYAALAAASLTGLGSMKKRKED